MRYDIKCHDCGHIEERHMRMAELDNLKPCAKCGSTNVLQYIGSAPMTIFKGKGWFGTTGSYHKGKKEITMDQVERHENTGEVPMF